MRAASRASRTGEDDWGDVLTSVPQIGKTMWNSKGPMSKEEARKNVFKEPLAVRQPRLYSPPVTSHEPPPVWGAGAAEDADAIGKAEAIYDYAGTVRYFFSSRSGSGHCGTRADHDAASRSRTT